MKNILLTEISTILIYNSLNLFKSPIDKILLHIIGYIEKWTEKEKKVFDATPLYIVYVFVHQFGTIPITEKNYIKKTS